MNKILCFGSICKDIFFPTVEGKIMETPDDLTSQRKIAFELGAKYKIEKRHEALGGCAANVAVGIKKLGLKSACVSSVGNDLVGDWAVKELAKNEVGIEFIKKEEGRESDLSAIIVDKESADRVIFTSRSSSGQLNLDQEISKETDWFFISDVHGKWEEQIETLVNLAVKENKKIAFNPREAHIHEDPAEIIETIALCELVFVNKDEALEIVSNMHQDVSLEKINQEVFLLEKLVSLEPKIVVLTDGKNGAWVAGGGKKFFVKSLEVPAVDSTGAGDGFCSGFLSAYIKGKEIQECLQWGIANSANVVCHYGAIEGLLTEEEILEKIKNIKVEEL